MQSRVALVASYGGCVPLEPCSNGARDELLSGMEKCGILPRDFLVTHMSCADDDSEKIDMFLRMSLDLIDICAADKAKSLRVEAILARVKRTPCLFDRAVKLISYIYGNGLWSA
jgi:hypothetical protein